MAIDYDEKILSWAQTQKNIKALIQIGSRAQLDSRVDQWSDWDYHLICQRVAPYINYDWSAIFGNSIWASYTRKTNRNAIKVSLILQDGDQIDLVLLTAWQIKLIYFLMKHPTLHPFLPKVVKKGLLDLHTIVKPGYKIKIGGPEWEKRLDALKITLTLEATIQDSFNEAVSDFWQHATLTLKQIARGNYLAAQRYFHLHLREATFHLLLLEAKYLNKNPQKEARYAEHWLDATRLSHTEHPTAPTKAALLTALGYEIVLFDELTSQVAKHHSLANANYSGIKSWLQEQIKVLTQLTV